MSVGSDLKDTFLQSNVKYLFPFTDEVGCLAWDSLALLFLQTILQTFS